VAAGRRNKKGGKVNMGKVCCRKHLPALYPRKTAKEKVTIRAKKRKKLFQSTILGITGEGEPGLIEKKRMAVRVESKRNKN